MSHSYLRRKKSRLTKLEEKRNLQQAVLFGFLSICLLFFLLLGGIPFLTRFVVFLGSLKKPVKSEKSETIAPNPPTFLPTFEATNSSPISLTGLAEAKTKVKLVLNGQAYKEITVSNQGEFKVPSLALKDGKNEIKAQVIGADNNSQFSENLVIIFDQEKPPLELTSPNSGDRFFDEDREIKISGISEKDAVVYVNDRLAITDSQGNFSLMWELKEGDNQLKIKAQDLAGNISEKEVKVSYTP